MGRELRGWKFGRVLFGRGVVLFSLVGVFRASFDLLLLTIRVENCSLPGTFSSWVALLILTIFFVYHLRLLLRQLFYRLFDWLLFADLPTELLADLTAHLFLNIHAILPAECVLSLVFVVLVLGHGVFVIHLLDNFFDLVGKWLGERGHVVKSACFLDIYVELNVEVVVRVLFLESIIRTWSQLLTLLLLALGCLLLPEASGLLLWKIMALSILHHKSFHSIRRGRSCRIGVWDRETKLGVELWLLVLAVLVSYSFIIENNPAHCYFLTPLLSVIRFGWSFRAETVFIRRCIERGETSVGYVGIILAYDRRNFEFVLVCLFFSYGLIFERLIRSCSKFWRIYHWRLFRAPSVIKVGIIRLSIDWEDHA